MNKHCFITVYHFSSVNLATLLLVISKIGTMLAAFKISSRISNYAISSVVPSAFMPIIVPFAQKKKIVVQSRPEDWCCDRLYECLPRRGVMETRAFAAMTFRSADGLRQHRKHILLTSTIFEVSLSVSDRSL